MRLFEENAAAAALPWKRLLVALHSPSMRRDETLQLPPSLPWALAPSSTARTSFFLCIQFSSLTPAGQSPRSVHKLRKTFPFAWCMCAARVSYQTQQRLPVPCLYANIVAGALWETIGKNGVLPEADFCPQAPSQAACLQAKAQLY